jgi:hypothetical protein
MLPGSIAPALIAAACSALRRSLAAKSSFVTRAIGHLLYRLDHFLSAYFSPGLEVAVVS